MRIAIITPYRDFPGGVEVVNQILCRLFRKHGHIVDLVTTDGYAKTMHNRLMIKIIGLPYITAKKFRSMPVHYDLVITNGEFGFGIEHPHAISLFHGCYRGFMDYLRPQLSMKQIVGFTKLAFIQRMAAKQKYVVSVSEFIRQILENDGIKVDQVISNCIDLNRFRVDQDICRSDKYLFVGASNYYAKGFDILEELSRKGFQIDCVTNIMPNKPLEWIATVDNDLMPVIYNGYRALIFPSRFEGLGLVPLEAMACGLPVVISPVGLGTQLKKVVPEFVADTYDVAEYIHKLHKIEDDYEGFSAKARAYVEQYHSYDIYANEWLSLIEKVKNA